MSEITKFECNSCRGQSDRRDKPLWLTFGHPVLIRVKTAVGNERIELLGSNAGNDFCCPECLHNFILSTISEWQISAEEEVSAREDE